MKYGASFVAVVCFSLVACKDNQKSTDDDHISISTPTFVELVKSYEMDRPKVIAEVIGDLRLSSEDQRLHNQRGCQLNYHIERENVGLTLYLDDPDAGRRDYEVKVIGVEVFRDGKSLAESRVSSPN